MRAWGPEPSTASTAAPLLTAQGVAILRSEGGLPRVPTLGWFGPWIAAGLAQGKAATILWGSPRSAYRARLARKTRSSSSAGVTPTWLAMGKPANPCAAAAAPSAPVRPTESPQPGPGSGVLMIRVSVQGGQQVFSPPSSRSRCSPCWLWVR